MLQLIIEKEWKREWFPSLPTYPHSYWTSFENRVKFLEEIKVKYQIKEPKDWGNISIQKVKESGGEYMLKKYYNESLFQCLQSLYKGTFKCGSHVSKKSHGKKNGSQIFLSTNSYWKELENGRNFLEEVRVI